MNKWFLTAALSAFLSIIIFYIDKMNLLILLTIFSFFFIIYHLKTLHRDRTKRWLLKQRKGIFFGFFIAAIFIFRCWLPDQTMPSVPLGEGSFVVSLRDAFWCLDDKEKQKSLFIDLLSSKKPIKAHMTLSCKYFEPFFFLPSGTKIRLKAVLDKPSSARNPFAFDLAQMLFLEDVSFVIIPLSIEKKFVYKKDFMFFVDKTRFLLAKKINESFASSLKGVAFAVLLGDKTFISMKSRLEYTMLGLAHLLVVSGIHVSFCSRLIALLTNKFPPKMHVFFVSMSIISYVIMAGAGSSALRAGGMAIILFLASLRKSVFKASYAFSIMLFVSLLYKPSLAFSLGFQLSYGITFFLLFLAPHIKKRLPVFLGRMRNSLTIAFTSQLVSLPLTLKVTPIVSIFSLPLNLILVPLYGFLLIPSLFILLFLAFLWPEVTLWLSQGLGVIVMGLQNLLARLASLPFCHIVMPITSFNAQILLTLSIGYFVFAWLKRTSYLHRIFSSLSGILLIFLFLYAPFNIHEIRVTILDVGQGDAIVIELPYRKVIVIDTGGRYSQKEAASSVLLSFLWQRGFAKIDQLVLTHGDIDHIGDLASLVDRISIKRLIRSPYPAKPFEQILLTKLQRKGTQIIYRQAGDFASLASGVSWRFLHPSGVNESLSINEHSLVFLLRLYKWSFLFTGDVEEVGEASIQQKFVLPKVDFLKVAHHGSKTSSTLALLEQLKPKHAFISVGKFNRYHHPDPLVLQRLNQLGTTIWRTDQHGAITLMIKPTFFSLTTMLKPNLYPLSNMRKK